MSKAEDEILDELEQGKAGTGRVIKAMIDPKRLSGDLKFTDATLKDAFIDQAGLFAYYASKEAQAAYQTDKQKQALEIVEARVDHEIRQDAADQGTKITEGKITSGIRLNASYQKALEGYNQAKMIQNLAKAATEAFKQRRDMLIQCGADAREELKGSLRMSGSEANTKDRAAAFANSQKS